MPRRKASKPVGYGGKLFHDVRTRYDEKRDTDLACVPLRDFVKAQELYTMALAALTEIAEGQDSATLANVALRKLEPGEVKRGR